MQLEPSCMTECPINYGFANAVPGSKVTTYITLGDFEQLLLLIRATFQGFHTVGSEGLQLCSFNKPQTPLLPPISFVCKHWNLFSFHNFGFIHSSFLDHQRFKPSFFSSPFVHELISQGKQVTISLHRVGWKLKTFSVLSTVSGIALP